MRVVLRPLPPLVITPSLRAAPSYSYFNVDYSKPRFLEQGEKIFEGKRMSNSLQKGAACFGLKFSRITIQNSVMSKHTVSLKGLCSSSLHFDLKFNCVFKSYRPTFFGIIKHYIFGKKFFRIKFST